MKNKKYLDFEKLTGRNQLIFERACMLQDKINKLKIKINEYDEQLKEEKCDLLIICKDKKIDGIKTDDCLAYTQQGTTAPKFLDVVAKTKVPEKYKQQFMSTYDTLKKKQNPILKLQIK